MSRMLWCALMIGGLAVLAGCRPAAESTPAVSGPAPDTTAAVEEAAPGVEIDTSPAAEPVDPEDLPVFGRLTFDPEVVEPGAEVRIRSDSLSRGTLRYAIPGTAAVVEVPFQDGEARVVIPEQAAAGTALAYVMDEKGSLVSGSFRVVTEPGLWLVMERTVVEPGEAIRVRAYAYGLPEGLYAFIEFTPPPPDEAPAEEGPAPPASGSADSEGTLRLVPDAEGLLVPGPFFGVPLEEFVGRDLYLRGGEAGQYQLVAADTGAYQQALAEAGNNLEALSALDEPDVEEWTSAALTLEMCTRPGALEGALGGPGWVSVFPSGPRARPLTQHTADGRFRLEVASGPAFVLLQPDDGAAPRSQFVTIPCGGTATLTASTGAHLLARPALALAGVGDVARVQPGASPGALRQAGEAASLCDRAVVFAFNFVSGISAEEQAAFAAPMEHALTAQLQQTATRVSFFNSIMAEAMLAAMARAQLRGEESEYSLADIALHLSGKYVVYGDVFRFKDVPDYYMTLVVLDAQRAERLFSARLQAPTLAAFTKPGTYAQFAETFAEAGLCGDVEVTPPVYLEETPLLTMPPAGERDFQVRVTNLAGKAVPAKLALKAQPTCGELDPTLPTEVDESGELTLTYKGQGDESCVETLTFEATRIYTAPTNLRPPKDTMPLYVAVGPLLEIGVGAMQAEGFRTEAPSPLAAVTVAEADGRLLETLPGRIAPLNLQGTCQMMAPLFLPDWGRTYSVASTQTGHEGRASMKVEVDPETGVTRLILEAEAKATPPNPGQRQPIYTTQALLSEPLDMLMFYGALPVLYVVNVQVPPELQGMPARMRMVWTVEGEQEGVAGWHFEARAAMLECYPDNPNNPALVQWLQGFVHYRLLVAADGRPARKEWILTTSSLPEHLQFAIWTSGGASAASEVFDPLDGGLIPYGGRAYVRAQMEVQLLPDPSAGSPDGGG